MVFKPESLVTLREKDASALRAAYGEIKEQYEAVLDKRDHANKNLERMRQKYRDLQTALDAADQKAASVSRPGFSLEFEQGKSKIAELQAALKQEVARSKATQSELEATRSELEESRDCVRDLDNQLSTVVAENNKFKVFRDRIVHALDDFDAFGDGTNSQTTGPRLPGHSSRDTNPPAHPPYSTLTVEEQAKGHAAEEVAGPALEAEYESLDMEYDVEPEAVVPKEEPESSPQPIQAPAPTPKGAYLAQPRISVPNHAIASLTSSWGPTPRQWMTIKQQEEFKDQLAELEAYKHGTNLLDATKSGVSAVNNVVPANPTPRISALPAARQHRKRDAPDSNMELIAQEDVEMGLEEMPRQSTPEEPERKKPRLGGL